jgi:lipopolysaccharide export system permease protein
VIWSLLHRSIFGELLKVFLLAYVALTGILLIAGVITEATRSGLGPTQILAAIPLLIPSTIPFTLPTTTLFAASVVYGRLSNDNEILALKAAGVHMIHVVWPGIVLGAAATAVTFGLYMDTIPYTHFILRTQIVSDVKELMYGMLKKDGCIRHPRFNYEIFVKRVQGERLIDAEFRRREPKTQTYDYIVVAKEAELLVDMAHRRLYIRMKHSHIANNTGAADVVSDENVLQVDLPEDFAANQAKTRPSDMTWLELFEARDAVFAEKDAIDADIALHQAAINLGNAEPHFPQHVRDKLLEKRQRDLMLLALDSELHLRPAFALGCFCFVLVGCPIGIWFSKSDYLSAFITCFLPIVVIYYPLMLCSINMSRSGKLMPAAGIYAADALIFAVGLLMFRRLARH